MKVITEYKKPVPLDAIFLGEMFECRNRPAHVCEEELFYDEKDGTPFNTPLMRIQAYSNTDIKDGCVFAVDPHTGFTYMIPRNKEVVPLESELTVKK